MKDFPKTPIPPLECWLLIKAEKTKLRDQILSIIANEISASDNVQDRKILHRLKSNIEKTFRLNINLWHGGEKR